MFRFGFSTGALALGDFRAALAMLVRADVTAVELSALREHELPELMQAADTLPLGRFKYVSVHAPSRFNEMTEENVAGLLFSCVRRGWRVVVHPDSIIEPKHWLPFGAQLCIENMDKRKRTGRTAAELREIFDILPKASLCFDLAHARQVDTTLGVARAILAEFGKRLAQVHLSELDSNSHHVGLSIVTLRALTELAHWMRPVPIILESQIPAKAIDAELRFAAEAVKAGKLSGSTTLASA